MVAFRPTIVARADNVGVVAEPIVVEVLSPTEVAERGLAIVGAGF